MLAPVNYYFFYQELYIFVCLQARKKLHSAPLKEPNRNIKTNWRSGRRFYETLRSAPLMKMITSQHFVSGEEEMLVRLPVAVMRTYAHTHTHTLTDADRQKNDTLRGNVNFWLFHVSFRQLTHHRGDITIETSVNGNSELLTSKINQPINWLTDWLTEVLLLRAVLCLISLKKKKSNLTWGLLWSFSWNRKLSFLFTGCLCFTWTPERLTALKLRLSTFTRVLKSNFEVFVLYLSISILCDCTLLLIYISEGNIVLFMSLHLVSS